MATITVRNLDDDVQRRIRELAAHHNRSMEAEARAILTAAVERKEFGAALAGFRCSAPGVELELPARSDARDPIEL